MEKSFSGREVLLENAIFEVPLLLLFRARTDKPVSRMVAVNVPEGHIAGGVSSADYDAYRRGLDSACADIVITTVLPNGYPAVMAVKRKSGKCLAGKWWMQGGAIHSYRLIEEFVAERAEKECGIRPEVQALIGVYRTCAEDFLSSTTNLCYAGQVKYDDIVKKGKLDADHTNVRLLTRPDLARLPEDERHWYPMRTFELALDSMPER